MFNWTQLTLIKVYSWLREHEFYCFPIENLTWLRWFHLTFQSRQKLSVWKTREQISPWRDGYLRLEWGMCWGFVRCPFKFKTHSTLISLLSNPGLIRSIKISTNDNPSWQRNSLQSLKYLSILNFNKFILTSITADLRLLFI